MSDDNILRVGASVDLAGFQSGLPAAASLVEQNTRRMVDSFVKVLTGSTQASKQVLVDWAGRPFQPAADSAEVMRQSVDISAESIKALSDVMHGAKQQSEETASGWEGFANKVEGFITHPLDAAGGFAKKLLMDLGPVGAVAIGAAAGLAELGKQAFDLVNGEGAAARQTQNLATQLGLSYEQAKKLGEMARLVDIDIAGLTRVSLRLADALEHGGKEFDALKKLGVNATEAGPALLQTLEKLSQIENVTVRLDAASEVLGKRQAMRLLPLIADYEKLGETIEALGGKLDEEHVKGLEEAHKQITACGIAWDHLKEAMAAKLAPTVTVIITAIKNALGDNAPTGPEEIPGARKVESARAALAAAERGGGPPLGSQAVLRAVTQNPLTAPAVLYGQSETAKAAAIKQASENLQKALNEQDALFKKGIDDQAAAVTKAASDKTYDAAFAHSIETLKKKLEEVHETVGKTEREKDLPGHTKALKEEEALKAQIKAAEKAQSGQATAERNAIAEKKLENEKQLGLEMVAQSERLAKQKLHDGIFTIEQETNALRVAEKVRYDLEVDYAHQTDALKAGTARAEKKPAPAGTDFELLAAKHEGRDTDIVNAGANKADARDDTTARDQIKDAQTVAQARVEQEIHASKAALAARHASIDEQTQAERDAAEELHIVKWNELNDSLRLAKEDPSNPDKVKTIKAQIETEEIQHQTKLADITADGAKKKRDEEIAYQTAVENAAIASATRTYDFAKARIEEQFKHHEIDAKERIKLLRDIEEQEYKTQLAAAQGERGTAIAKHGGDTKNADVVNAQAKVDTLGAKHEGVTAGLDEESKHAFTNMQQTAVGAINGISQAFEGGISKWLSQTKNFGAAMGQSFRGMADTAINNIVRMTAQMLSAFALQKAIGQKSVMSKAYESAANTWATVTASGIGGPFNPVIAAAEAAGVFALVAALGSFEYGGVVPTTGVKFLHEGERVLTPRDNASFEKAIRVGAAVGSGGAGGIGGAGGAGGAAGAYYAYNAAPRVSAAAAPGTFDLGGIVPKTQMSLLHGGQRELTQNQNSRLDSAPATGGPGGGHTYNYNAAQGESPDSVTRNAAAYKRAMRDGRRLA